MKKIYLILSFAVMALASCTKSEETPTDAENPIETPKQFRVLGYGRPNNADNVVPVLWTDKRELNFLPAGNNAHLEMWFMEKVGGNWLYFGVEDTHLPSSSKVCMWGKNGKMVLSQQVSYNALQENIVSYSFNPVSKDVVILVYDGTNNWYYYKINSNGTVTRTTINVGAYGTPVYIQASGADVHLLTVTQDLSDEQHTGKTTIKHLKNNTYYASYEIAAKEEEYIWNNLRFGTAYIDNDVVQMLDITDQSGEAYYHKLTKGQPVVEKLLNTNGYSLAFAANSGSYSSNGGSVFENGKFYIGAEKDFHDIAYFTINVQGANPTLQKTALEAPAGYDAYSPAQVFKIGADIYVTGLADSFGAYWKNGKLTVLDKTGIDYSYISDLHFE